MNMSVKYHKQPFREKSFRTMCFVYFVYVSYMNMSIKYHKQQFLEKSKVIFNISVYRKDNT